MTHYHIITRNLKNTAVDAVSEELNREHNAVLTLIAQSGENGRVTRALRKAREVVAAELNKAVKSDAINLAAGAAVYHSGAAQDNAHKEAALALTLSQIDLMLGLCPNSSGVGWLSMAALATALTYAAEV